MHAILLVEPDEARRAALSERIAADHADLEVLGAASGTEAIAALEQRQDLKLIITPGTRAGSVDSFQLTLTAREHCPKARLLLLLDLPQEALAGLSPWASAGLASDTAEPEALSAQVGEIKTGVPGSAGTIGELGLLDLMIVAGVCHRSTTLRVRKLSTRGLVAFRDGAIEHAELGERQGTEALHEVISLEGGDVFFQSQLDEREPTITGAWHEALLAGVTEIEQRRARRAQEEAEARAQAERETITEDDLGQLLGLEAPGDHEALIDDGPKLFSDAELEEIGELSMPDPANLPGVGSPQWSREPSQADLGRPSDEHNSGRRFARIPSTSGLTAPPPPPSRAAAPSAAPTGPPAPPTAPADRRTVGELLEALQYDIPEFQATDVVHRKDGISVASFSINPVYDSATASAFYSDMLNASARACGSFGISPRVRDLQVATDYNYILIRNIGDSPFCHLVLMSKDGNLGVARVMMRRYEALLANALPR